MDVKEFVSETILQVMQAVQDVQAKAHELNAYVNPSATTNNAGTERMGTVSGGHGIYPMRFDIAVTVGAQAGAEGGGKLQVAGMFSIGAKANETQSEQFASRVQFTVPIVLPIDPVSTKERDAKWESDRQARGVPPPAGHPFG